MAVAAIAALSSCSSDNDLLSGETGKKALTFTATMEGSATRATYDSENKCASWEVGDQISVNGMTYNAQSAGLTTTFKAATPGEEAEGPTYNAYFACSSDGETATLPAEVSETWANGKFNMPMYATSDYTNLEFKNLCGVLKITVKSDQIDAVKSIKVSSANKAVSGAFTVTDNAAVLSDAENVANTLTVTYEDAVATTEGGKVFFVAVPAQTYQELKIELSADGNNFTKSMTTKSGTNITVERKKIYPITFADNAPATTGTAEAIIDGIPVDVNWVQLWAGGPKFAEFNVGAANNKKEDYGGYYAWGGRQNKVDDHNTGDVDLKDDADTAYKLWGSNWRMPTKAELEALIANCDVEWTNNYKETGVKGKVFTGKGNFASNSVFLPATGSCYNGLVGDQGNNGHYWSSTPDGSGYGAYFLYFRSDSQYVDYDSRFNGYSVRAVLAEGQSDQTFRIKEDQGYTEEIW